MPTKFGDPFLNVIFRSFHYGFRYKFVLNNCVNLILSLHFFFGICFSSWNSIRSSSGNKTNLATSAGSSLDGRSLFDMLVVTTSMGIMLNGIYGNTVYLVNEKKVNNLYKTTRKVSATKRIVY